MLTTEIKNAINNTLANGKNPHDVMRDILIEEALENTDLLKAYSLYKVVAKINGVVTNKTCTLSTLDLYTYTLKQCEACDYFTVYKYDYSMQNFIIDSCIEEEYIRG